MKICIAIDGVIKGALKSVFRACVENHDISHNDPATADVIICMGKGDLEALYSQHQHFLLIGKPPHGNLPKNVKELFVVTDGFLKKVLEQLDIWRTETDDNPPKVVPSSVSVRTGEEYVPNDTSDSLRILVVDDKVENLVLALELLGNRHYVTLASGYGEGRQLIDDKKYDVVLCDCQMPVRSDASSSLAIKNIEFSPVSCGPLLMFRATGKGAHFAIVTAANHPADWMTTLLEDLREPQIVNGRTVLFITSSQKRWDRALEKLLFIARAH